jgi:hypothetical protein
VGGVGVLVALLVGGAARGDDHPGDFEPEQGPFGLGMEAYPATVADVLLRAHRYRLCQMVFIPSSEKERAVYVVRAGDETRRFTVVSVEMKQHLWGAMLRRLDKQGRRTGQHPFDEAARRKALAGVPMDVIRREAPLDAETVGLLEKAWTAVLRRVRHPATAYSGLDGARFHAAHVERGYGYLTGQTWSPPEGTLAVALVDLAESLAELAAAPGEAREAVKIRLVAQAERLLERVRRGQARWQPAPCEGAWRVKKVETVVLRSGERVTGRVMEVIPREHAAVCLANGVRRRIDWDQIAKFNDKPAPATPAAPPTR